MSEYGLIRLGNKGWSLNTIDRVIDIIRLTSVGDNALGIPSYGVSFTENYKAKDSSERITLSLPSLDPHCYDHELSLVDITKKMLHQVRLGTFEEVISPYEHGASFLEYVLVYLGESTDSDLTCRIRIPLTHQNDKSWHIDLGDFRYRASRDFSHITGLFTTVVVKEHIREEPAPGIPFKFESVTTISSTAKPLILGEWLNLFVSE